jgi:hypothetical protein
VSQPPPKKVPEDVNEFGFLKSLIDGLYFLWEEFQTGLIRFPSYTVADLPDAEENERRMVYVSDETGGATMAFSDGINWRRVQDRAIVS